MCESHPVEPAPEEGHTRRSFLTRVALGASTVLVPGTLRGLLGAPAAAAAPPPPGTNYLNETAYRAAMHLHAAFSEVTGSLSGHISQAITNGVGIVVPTDHDWRIQLRHYGGQYHFSNWSEPTPSGYWSLLRRPGIGSLTATSGATLVSGGAAPGDQTAGAGALRLVAGSTKSSTAKVAYEVDSQTSNADAKGTVLGRALHIWVKADSTSNARTYLGLQLGLANDPGYGPKQITYRLRTDLTAPTQPTVTGGNAVIDVPVLRGQWFELVPELLADIAACWPSALPEDNSLNSMVLLAVGDKVTTVSGLFSYLHLETDPTYDPAAAYSSVLQHYRVANPGLLVPNGMEHSVDTHKCQLGGQQFFYAYPDTGDPSTHTSYGSAVAADLVAQIQAHDGVASYNHPFGIVTTSPPIGAKRTAALTAQMTAVLASKCHGADCMEVGYNSRGMDLAGHLELFDCLSANGAFLTATGVSDDHVGKDWLAQNNRFVTLPWMVGLTEEAFKTALRVGRASVGLLGNFTGSLDLSINRIAYMGQAYCRLPSAADQVVLDAYGLPSGATVSLYGGAVDFGGVGFQRPSKIADFGASSFALGSVSAPAVGSGPRYYRFTVQDSGGAVIAFTNPVWQIPPGSPVAVPANRFVP